MLLFVGLGNPTPDSENNRHNVGYLFIDQLLQDHDDVMREKKFDGELASFLIGKKKITNNDKIMISNKFESKKIRPTISALGI